MIAYLDELFAKLFGERAEEHLPIPVRVDDDESARDKQLKGRR
jgi:hypothetical protein